MMIIIIINVTWLIKTNYLQFYSNKKKYQELFRKKPYQFGLQNFKIVVCSSLTVTWKFIPEWWCSGTESSVAKCLLHLMWHQYVLFEKVICVFINSLSPMSLSCWPRDFSSTYFVADSEYLGWVCGCYHNGGRSLAFSKCLWRGF